MNINIIDALHRATRCKDNAVRWELINSLRETARMLSKSDDLRESIKRAEEESGTAITALCLVQTIRAMPDQFPVRLRKWAEAVCAECETALGDNGVITDKHPYRIAADCKAFIESTINTRQEAFEKAVGGVENGS